MQIKSREDVEKAADALTRLGVHRMFISLGAEGVYAAMGAQKLWLPNIPGQMVNTTGLPAAMAAATSGLTSRYLFMFICVIPFLSLVWSVKFEVRSVRRSYVFLTPTRTFAD